MVFCNRNHKLLFEKIKDKIKAEYDELVAEARARVGRLVSTERQGQNWTIIGPQLDHNLTKAHQGTSSTKKRLVFQQTGV